MGTPHPSEILVDVDWGDVGIHCFGANTPLWLFIQGIIHLANLVRRFHHLSVAFCLGSGFLSCWSRLTSLAQSRPNLRVPLGSLVVMAPKAEPSICWSFGQLTSKPGRHVNPGCPELAWRFRCRVPFFCLALLDASRVGRSQQLAGTTREISTETCLYPLTSSEPCKLKSISELWGVESGKSLLFF